MILGEQFLIHDGKIGDFLKAVLALQATMFGLVAIDTVYLNCANPNILMARQVVGFVYLTLVPGAILLRILGLYHIGLVRSTLYCVGLSIGFLMFIMLLMNTFLPALGFPDPLSCLSLLIVVSISLLFLCAISYLKDRNFAARVEVNAEKVSVTAVLAIVWIPLMSVFGTILANSYGTNIVLLLMLVTISSVPVLVAFGRVDRRLYPFLTMGIAVALLYHFSLMSNYLVGWDSHSEYYFYRYVEANSIWNPAIPDSYNSALSVVMLPVLYSQFMRIDGVWISKIVYPLIYSLVPVGLYEVYRRQTNARIAFLAVFFFMSVFTFFNEMPALGRQEVAELFIVLLMLLMLDDKIPSRKRAMLFMFFGASMVVSHYGVTYLYMLYLATLWFFVSLLRNLNITPFLQSLFTPFSRILNGYVESEHGASVKSALISRAQERKTITVTLVIFIFVFALVWYINVSSSVTFESIVHIVSRVYNGIVSEFLVVGTRGPSILHALGLGSGIIIRENSLIVLCVTELFIVVGVIGYVARAKETNFTLEYGGMALTSLTIILTLVILPYFAGTLGISRIYHFTMLFLAPFCVIGGETVFDGILKLSRRSSVLRRKEMYIALLTCAVLIIYFLFNTGFIYEVIGDAPSSVALSLERMKMSNDNSVKTWFRSMIDSQQDVFGATWLSQTRNTTFMVYGDFISTTHVLIGYGLIPKDHIRILSNTTEIHRMTYTYLGQLNVMDGVMTGPESASELWKTTDISHVLQQENRVYSNCFTEIYSSP